MESKISWLGLDVKHCVVIKVFGCPLGVQFVSPAHVLDVMFLASFLLVQGGRAPAMDLYPQKPRLSTPVYPFIKPFVEPT